MMGNPRLGGQTAATVLGLSMDRPDSLPTHYPFLRNEFSNNEQQTPSDDAVAFRAVCLQ